MAPAEALGAGAFAQTPERVAKCGPMARNAISEQYPLLRTIQMAQIGYMRALTRHS